MTNIKDKKKVLETIINNASFLSDEEKTGFLSAVSGANESNIDSIYQEFIEAKKKIEIIYMKIALGSDKKTLELLKNTIKS